GGLFLFVDRNREDLGGDVFRLELGARRVKILRRLIEPIGENAQELPEKLDGELVLLAQDLEEVAAADANQLARALGVDRRASRDAADQGHFAEMLARAERREQRVTARHPHLAGQADEKL